MSKIPIVEIPEGVELDVRLLGNGRWQLLSNFHIKIGGRLLMIPKDFEMDFSSWPRFLPGPRMEKIALAGLVHDALCFWGKWGPNGEEIGYMEANRTWYYVARSGSHPGIRTGWLWAWVGRIGLFLFCWPVWLSYRIEDAYPRHG